MYRYYEVMVCLLKFDFFCFSGVTMQVCQASSMKAGFVAYTCHFPSAKMLIVVLQTDSAEFGVTIAAVPVVIILLIFCGIAVQREVKW
jgi:hypothetical protein